MNAIKSRTVQLPQAEVRQQGVPMDFYEREGSKYPSLILTISSCSTCGFLLLTTPLSTFFKMLSRATRSCSLNPRWRRLTSSDGQSLLSNTFGLMPSRILSSLTTSLKVGALMVVVVNQRSSTLGALSALLNIDGSTRIWSGSTPPEPIIAMNISLPRNLTSKLIPSGLKLSSPSLLTLVSIKLCQLWLFLLTCFWLLTFSIWTW